VSIITDMAKLQRDVAALQAMPLKRSTDAAMHAAINTVAADVAALVKDLATALVSDTGGILTSDSGTPLVPG
jgi:hypothetical protein